ncbi:hypothetical protein Leryth_026363 [Lithospermum erythrorhizon]|nr:hypothetical protein Leryth_026363 [Lithospermum erythrorhizon]
MEALNILKFWRKPIRRDNVAMDDVIDYDSSGDEEFFELELNLTKYRNEHDSKQVESARDVFRNATVFPIDSPISTSKPQSPISLRKFKVFMLGFKKSKAEEIGQSKRCSFKTNVEQVPDNSLRTKLLKENFQDDKKDVPKYIKPDKLKFSESSPASRTSGLRNVYKNFGKSKSLVTASPVNRTDDSLLQDGIQGAILHCNTSYNSPANELSRCVSEKTGFGGRDSELMKRSSI